MSAMTVTNMTLMLSHQMLTRDGLLKALRKYFDQKGFTADWDAIRSCDSEKLVTTLSMICPFGVQDKQALLEADTVTTRS